MYMHGLYTRDVNALAYIEFCIQLENAIELLLCTSFLLVYIYVYVLHILYVVGIIGR